MSVLSASTLSFSPFKVLTCRASFQNFFLFTSTLFIQFNIELSSLDTFENLLFPTDYVIAILTCLSFCPPEGSSLPLFIHSFILHLLCDGKCSHSLVAQVVKNLPAMQEA